MNATKLVVSAAAVILAAGAATAQEAAPATEGAPVTVEGTVVTSEWGAERVLIYVDGKGPDGENHRWRVRAPGARTLLDMHLSANVLQQGAPIAITGRLDDATCADDCVVLGEAVTVGQPGQSFELSEG